MSDADEIDVLTNERCTQLDSQTASSKVEIDFRQPVEASSEVSARTDGLCGKRYDDYHVEDSSGPESGELTDSEIDVLGDGEEPETKVMAVPDDISKASTGPISNYKSNFCDVSKRRVNSFIHQLDDDAVRTVDDVKGILSHIKSEPDFDFVSNPGVGKLLSEHRPVIPVISDSSDGEFNLSDSDSSDEDYKAPISITSEINRMESMNIKDNPFREKFPEVEIIDLVLSEIEMICPLGYVYQIVEDFVVVKGRNHDEVLDLDSMIFDEKRKCVGYVFEVLGPVREPFYSIHFNTNSDIANMGLHLNQELFYSPNENYSRYLLVEKLRELEFNSRHRRNSHGVSDESDSSESETDEKPKPLAGVKRKPKKQLQNRTTSNYTVSYTSTQNYPIHSERLPQSLLRPHRGSHGSQNVDPAQGSYQNNLSSRRGVTNSFGASVLASFNYHDTSNLDPFGLHKPDS